MIVYPVRASGDGTERIIDAAGQVLGTVEIVAALNNPAIRVHHVETGTIRIDDDDLCDDGEPPIPQARPHHEAEYVPGRGTWGELT